MTKQKGYYAGEFFEYEDMKEFIAHCMKTDNEPLKKIQIEEIFEMIVEEIYTNLLDQKKLPKLNEFRAYVYKFRESLLLNFLDQSPLPERKIT